MFTRVTFQIFRSKIFEMCDLQLFATHMSSGASPYNSSFLMQIISAYPRALFAQNCTFIMVAVSCGSQLQMPQFLRAQLELKSIRLLSVLPLQLQRALQGKIVAFIKFGNSGYFLQENVKSVECVFFFIVILVDVIQHPVKKKNNQVF